ncbi:hypothetical protein [Nocardioides albus]|uniref:Uncharacterized protein n=1 Tax=Nocardioides albus TaxID=1841 RepID=A0A7W5F9M5_9ACTN|nr:hypothetical protein [Nocardioides albus]MBB3090221.1 hypothetical protein [Nocardioides albus]
MTNNSDGLIRSALRGNEETASRLRRTQLLGVLALVVATLAAPVVRLADDDADLDRQLNIWAAIQWIADAQDASDGLPASYAWLAIALYVALLFVVSAPVLAIVLAVQRGGAARVAAGIAAGVGAVVTLSCWLIVIGDSPEGFADLQPHWGVLLPLVLGLWTANILETDD